MNSRPPPSTPIRIPGKTRAPASSHHRRPHMTPRSIEEEIRKATNKLEECERCKITNEQTIKRLEQELLQLRSKKNLSGYFDYHPLSLSSLRTVNKASGRRKGRTKKKGKRKKRKTRRRR
jgi:hypothetical protein